MEAAAVGEHLAVMRPADAQLHRDMIFLYTSLAMAPKTKKHIQALVDLFAIRQHWYDIKNMISGCAQSSDYMSRVGVCSDIITIAHKAGCPGDIIRCSIEQVLDGLFLIDNEKCLQGFLSALQVYSDELHDYAIAYLTK